MKKIFALFCIFMMLITMGIFDFSAIIQPDYMGDADCDYSVDINDATAIQKHIANIKELSGLGRYLADVDNDIKVTIRDATAIQKHVADFDEGTYSAGDFFWQETNIDFSCSHLSGKAWVGEEITFSTNSLGRYYLKEDYVNSLYVNGELVAQGKTNDFTHIFTEPGTYDVKIVGCTSYDDDGVGYSRTWNDYEVKSPAASNEVVIKSFKHSQDHYEGVFYVNEPYPTFEVTAQGGSGEYEYLFMIDGKSITDNYQKSNMQSIDLDLYFDPIDEWGHDYGKHTISVYVRDALNNSVFDVYNYTFRVELYRLPA